MAWGAFKEKKYPEEYDPLAVRVLEKMSFPLGKLQLFGSMTIPSQLYAGDYDGVDYVSFKSLEEAVKEFQIRIKEVAELSDCFIADMKIGEIPEWNIWDDKTTIGFIEGRFVISNYNKNAIISKIDSLRTKEVISEEMAKEMKDTVLSWGENPDPRKYVEYVKDHRHHILRWTLKEVEAGVKELPGKDKKSISLAKALSSGGVVKVDSIGIVGGESRFTDFSVIYEIRIKNKVVSAKVVGTDIERELRQSMFENIVMGNYYKALKRMFSLARFYRQTDILKRLSEFFNGTVGIVYQVKSDIGTLLYLEENYENLPREKIRYELEMFRVRLTAFQETYKNQTLNSIIAELLSSKSKPKTIRFYKEMEDKLTKIINNVGREEMEKIDAKLVMNEKNET